MVQKFLYLSLFVSMACAASYIGRLPKKPTELAHKDGCYVKELNDVIPFGMPVASPLGSCYEIECSKHRIYYNTCGVVSTTDQDCYETNYDTKRPYPECCPTIKCESDNFLY